MSKAAASAPEDGGDIRPVVRTAHSGNRAMWAFAAILIVGGLLLFSMLNSRRQDMVAATALPAGEPGGAIAAPPPLALPSWFVEGASNDGYRPQPQAPRSAAPAVQPQVVTRIVEREVPVPAPMPGIFQPSPPPPSSIVLDGAPGELAPIDVPLAGNDRVTAGRLLNPSLTIPQGTIIAAVLETALDSTRPGGVRAIVSRDVRSFDGNRILVPRGSRLYGEYASDVSAGQKRALIRWRRLTRPDAVIIDLDSPSADPLGRAGVEGDVDTHFFARFGSAILQSVLDIGVGLATRSVTDDAVIVALPGSTQQVTGQLQQPQVQPTLRVRQGTSVSVFVARDLDFSTVDP